MTCIDGYLALRRSLGFKLEKAEALLRNFAAFSLLRGETVIRADLAVEWAGQAASAHQRSCRLKSVVALARHARGEDRSHELPPVGVFPCRRHRRIPHIFTSAEIEQVLEAARRLGPKRSLRPLTFHTLFALLACTGLRVSEAVRLRLGDLTPDGLLIEATKFRKSRLVPLHSTAQLALAKYLVRRRRVTAATDHLFISGSGKALRPDKASHVFLDLLRSAGLRELAGAGAHLHDLRHTFAVRALETAPTSGVGVGRHTVALSTYLGHARVSDTYWYLHATPQLMRSVGEASASLIFGGEG